jgi:predicted RNA polymerase sigma factor
VKGSPLRAPTGTDWPQILALYCVLRRMSDSPIVALNHAIATAIVDGPRAGLAQLETLDQDERLAGSHRLLAVRAHLLERAGEPQVAIELYRAAAARTTSTPERNYLLMRAARLREAS